MSRLALQYMEANNIRREIVKCGGNLGLALGLDGQLDDAITQLHAVVTVATQLQHPALQNYNYGHLAFIYLLDNQLEPALNAISISKRHPTPQNDPLIHALHATINFELNDIEAARESCILSQQTADILLEITPNFMQAYYAKAISMLALASLQQEEQQVTKGLQYLQEAMVLTDVIGLRSIWARCLKPFVQQTSLAGIQNAWDLLLPKQ